MTAPGRGEALALAERAVVGIGLRFNDRVDEVDLRPDHFGDPRWQHTWRAMQELRAESKSCDELSVADRLVASGIRSVPITDLSGAAIDVATDGALAHHASIIRQGHITRAVVHALADLRGKLDRGLGGSELLGEGLRLLSAIDVNQQDSAMPIGEIVGERLTELYELLEAGGAVAGIPTGLPGLDRTLGGYQRGIVTLVAGRPGSGKSSLLRTSADHCSARGTGVHYFSLEDTRDAFADRVLASSSGVAATELRDGSLNRQQLAELSRTATEIGKRQHWLVDDRSGLTAEEVVRSVRRCRRKNQTQLVCVDYAQLLRYQQKLSRHEGLTHTINVLADAAKQDRVAYVVGCQLNRSVESRENKRPMLADLRESGTLEERAKCVLMLYREALYNSDARADQLEILVRKNSNGRSNVTVLANWDGPTTRVW